MENTKTTEKNDKTQEKSKNIPWVEKYRPTDFENIVLDDINKKLFKNIIEKKYFPNLLLYGPPGTGKTTTIINLINEFQKKHYVISKNLIIHLNSSDERGIDIVRNQIYQFVKTNNLFDTGLKFVILDEVDYMTKTAQQALKCILQHCTSNVKFCLMCNYVSKIDQSLQNEFICVRFNQLPKKYIYEFINNISVNENLNLKESDINSIIDTYECDIRSMINFIQLNQDLKTNDWNENIISFDIFEKIHELLCEENINAKVVIEYILKISIQYNNDKKSIMYKYFNHLIYHHTDLINRDFLKIIENVLHSNETNVFQLLKYFCYNFKKIIHQK